MVRVKKAMCLIASGATLFVASGSCITDNLWANIFSGSIVTATADAIWAATLAAAGL